MNHRFFYVVIFSSLSVLLFAACDRANDPDQQLRRRLEAQAASEVASVTVSMGYIHQFQDPPAAEDDGDFARSPDHVLQARAQSNEEIEITEFYLVTSAIELHICEPGYDPTFGRLERLQQWILPSAHAHVPSSATRLGVPFVENLLAAQNQARIVGSIAPPVHDYCRLYAILSPADDDILNLTQLDTEQIEHKTMRVAGRFRADAQQPWQTFLLESDEQRVVEMKLIAPDTGKQPLSLAATKGHALILIEKTVGRELFDDIDTQTLLDGTAAATVLDRLISSFHIHEFSQEAP